MHAIKTLPLITVGFGVPVVDGIDGGMSGVGGRESAGLEDTEPAVDSALRAVTAPGLEGSGVDGTDKTD